MKKKRMRTARYSRKTRETDISLELDFAPGAEIGIHTGVPFFNHLLQAMCFHGRFGLILKARGDVEVDEHHLVEDTGLVFGEALSRLLEEHGPVQRFSEARVPMDEALSEAVIDVSGRPYLVFSGTFPQQRVGSFQTILVEEFLAALAKKARITIHVHLRYGRNSHHMAEALFKALGVALSRAYAPAPSAGMSTKGTLK